MSFPKRPTRCVPRLPSLERADCSKKLAEKTAYLQLIAKLDEQGILSEILSPHPGVDQLDKQTLVDEADAKTDIYNYAARFDCVPIVTALEVRRRHRGQTRKIIEVTVELPEQNIKVTGKGFELKMAEISAGIHFKQEAEKYHAEHGESSIVIKDSTTLNTGNIENFFAFYKILNRSTQIEVQTTPVRHLGSSAFRAQVLINGESVGEPVVMSAKKKAETLAYLTAAVDLKKKTPELYPQFLHALQAGNGEILRPLGAIDMPIDEDCVLVMKETLLSVRKAGLPDERDEVVSEEAEEVRKARFERRISPIQAKARTAHLQKSQEQYFNDPKLAELRQKRKDLPMSQYRAKVIDIVSNNTYSIIIGATGSGKTTQVPQILLEKAIAEGHGANCNIICTQPRRIAATSVARRVASERAENLQDSVGYQVRFDAKLPQIGGSITYCTAGILLQQLQHSPDEVLDSTSHLVIDEVHERDIVIDFLLIILKKVMTQRAALGKATPKVVLMSATMDTELFAAYFKHTSPGSASTDCPALSVPGRTYPVKEYHLASILETFQQQYAQKDLHLLQSDPATRNYLKVEGTFQVASASLRSSNTGTNEAKMEEEAVIDWKHERIVSSEGDVVVANAEDDALVPYGLVATTIGHITKSSQEGAILVFLPGLDEIVKVDELLRNGQVLGINFKDESKFKLYMLHSSISTGQTEVFEPVPEGCRKVILATNIAETSITIPDVQYVVDAGKLRQKEYDQVRRITQLKCTWISKSNSKQRAGRAGRVQNGNYYALFSKERYNSMRAIGLPEMLRADLQEICLDIKAQAFKSPIRDFLAESIEPPSPKAVDASVMNLQSLEALTDDEKITPLGRLLASLPVHPSLGKMIVLGVIFRCLDPMLLLGAAASERALFINPLQNRAEALEARTSFVQGSGSDHIAIINAMREIRRISRELGQHSMWTFSQRNYIHMGAFKNIDATARQIEQILVEAGLIPITPMHARHGGELGPPSLNENSHKVPIIKALALAGLHPNLAVANGGHTLRTPGERCALMHPSSINASPRGSRRGDRRDGDFPNKRGTLYSFSNMTRSNDRRTIFLRETSETTPLMASLFGGRIRNEGRVLTMDGWLPFYVQCQDWRAAKTVLEFKKALDRLLSRSFMDLSARRRNRNGERVYLADDEARALFAQGLVDVLDRDIKVGEAVAQWGWGAGGAGREGSERGRERRSERSRERSGERESRRDGSFIRPSKEAWRTVCGLDD